MCVNLSDIKDVFVIIGALTASIIAILGLGTWRKQLHGKTIYSLVRKLLMNTYKYRDAIQLVRSIFMSGEMENPPKEEIDKMTWEEIHYYNLQTGYNNRWKILRNIRIELETALLEAEVLWGKTIREKYNELFKYDNKLYANLQSYFYSKDPKRSSHYEENENRIKERDAIIFAATHELKDTFYQEILKHIKEIVDILKPYLPKGRKIK